MKNYIIAATMATTMLASCQKECYDIGYEGKDCQTEWSEKFVQTWVGQQQCTDGDEGFIITSWTRVDNRKFRIDGEITCEATGPYRFEIYQQTVLIDNWPVTVSGQGAYTDGKVDVTITYTFQTGAGRTCTFLLN